MSKLIRNDLEIGDFEETFWTDSKVVLDYIKNEVKQFKIYVANRIHIIKENSNVNQWKYISTKINPADDGSSGLDATTIAIVISRFSCPECLWQPEAEWDTSADFEIHDSDDSDVRHYLEVDTTIVQENNLLSNFEERISCWNKMKKVLAFVKKIVSILRQTANTKEITKNTSKQHSPSLRVKNINDSEETIIKLHQRRYF